MPIGLSNNILERVVFRAHQKLTGLQERQRDLYQLRNNPQEYPRQGAGAEVVCGGRFTMELSSLHVWIAVLTLL